LARPNGENARQLLESLLFFTARQGPPTPTKAPSFDRLLHLLICGLKVRFLRGSPTFPANTSTICGRKNSPTAGNDPSSSRSVAVSRPRVSRCAAAIFAALDRVVAPVRAVLCAARSLLGYGTAVRVNNPRIA
jgi:hypothetical protein